MFNLEEEVMEYCDYDKLMSMAYLCRTPKKLKFRLGAYQTTVIYAFIAPLITLR